jgi:CBS domain containing-hemolysin-like protein
VTIRLLAILALVQQNCFFVAPEFALLRTRRTRHEAKVRSGDKLSRIALRAVSNISRVLSASQLGVTLASLALGWIAESTLAGIFEGLLSGLPFAIEVSVRVTIAGIIAYTVLTYLHVVLGELTPKAAALNNPERVAKFLAPPLLLFAWVMSPFIWILYRSANSLLRLMGQPAAGEDESVHSPEELRLLVEQAQEGGAIQSSDADLLDAVFEFSEKTAREVMTPRTEIIALDVTATLTDVLQSVEESNFSRYPVYEESIDNIIGLILTKDLLSILITAAGGGSRIDRENHDMGDSSSRFSLRNLIRPVHVIPGSREVEHVLADFKRLKEHMAVVGDEYGGTAGIVTMEDLLEEIVGEILDEYDTPEDQEEPIQTRPGETLISGGTNVGELNDRFGLDIPDEDATTIGGFVFGVLGRLPQAGDRVMAGGAIFTVRSMDGRKIDTLAVDLHSMGDRRSTEREQQDAGTEAAPL